MNTKTVAPEPRADKIERLALSPDEAADALGVHPQTVRNYIRRGELPSRRLGTRIVVPIAALEAWLRGEAS